MNEPESNTIYINERTLENRACHTCFVINLNTIKVVTFFYSSPHTEEYSYKIFKLNNGRDQDLDHFCIDPFSCSV